MASLGIVPYLGLSFASYDILSERYPQNPQEDSVFGIVIRILGIGGLSGVSASFLTYPLDTIRFSKLFMLDAVCK